MNGKAGSLRLFETIGEDHVGVALEPEQSASANHVDVAPFIFAERTDSAPVEVGQRGLPASALVVGEPDLAAAEVAVDNWP